MPRRKIALVTLVVVATTAAVAAGEQGRGRHRWWQSADVRALLELTDEQSATLDTIYRKALPKLRESTHPAHECYRQYWLWPASAKPQTTQTGNSQKGR